MPRTRNSATSGISVSWTATEYSDSVQICYTLFWSVLFTIQQPKTIFEVNLLVWIMMIAVHANCSVNCVCSWFVAVIALWLSLLTYLLLQRLCKDCMKKMFPSCLLRMSVNMPIGRDVPKNLLQTWKLCMSVENCGGRQYLCSKVLVHGINPKQGRGLPQL